MTHSAAARPYLRTPAISPDGQQIAFVYATDIWLVGSAGGSAERLTAHPANHSSPRWSPDGQQIAFSADRSGNGEIYCVHLEGSNSAQITFHDHAATPEAWSPDGSAIYFSSGREMQGAALYRVQASGGTPIRWLSQPYAQIEHASISPDGQRIAFNITREPWWKRGPNNYSGSEVWMASNTPNPETLLRLGSDYSGTNRWPMWSTHGDGVYVVSDRDGHENIWLLPTNGSAARQITTFRDGRLLWPTISADGRVIVFERNFGIWTLDIASGHVAPIQVRVRAESKAPATRAANVTRDLQELELSPDGKKIAFIAHGEVFIDFADKETDRERRQGPSFRITNTPAREANVTWSHDSRHVFYTSDRDGEPSIYRYDVVQRIERRVDAADGSKHSLRFSPDGKWLAYACGDSEIRLIEHASGADQPFAKANFTRGVMFDWSPDSRWLAYTAQDDRAFVNVYIQQIGQGEARQISFLSNVSTFWPIWSPDGAFIIGTTRQFRAEQQIIRIDLQPRRPQFREDEFERLFVEPKAPADPPASEAASTEVRFEGIEQRLSILTAPQLDAMACAISPDSRDLLFHASVAGKGNLWVMALDDARAEQSPRQITSTNGYKGSVQFAPDGKSFYYTDASQIVIRKFPVGEATSLPISAEAVISFHEERLQIFDECWRVLRDRFYDPTFRGMDWLAIRDQFRPYAAAAQSSHDFRAILNLMQGELRASHTGVFGRSLPADDGYIGVLFNQHEQASSGRLIIDAVLPNGPAELAGVQIGDELLAVDDSEIAGGANLDALLSRTIGRRVRLRLRAADAEPREVALRPIAASSYDKIQYRAWVEQNKAYVHRESGGRLGYVHIREMSYAAYQRLLIDLDAEIHSREGIVIDIRFNGGGYIFSFILDVLSRRTQMRHGFRDYPATDSAHFHGNRVLNKPTVLVINQKTASNAEIFAEGYRQLGLGPIVGRPSAGAVISTTERSLLDGSWLRVPQYRVTTIDGEDLEGTGRPVDVDVEMPVGAGAHRRDPQLDAAAQALLARIDQAQAS